MTDRLTIEQRRFCMSKIRGRNTKPEIAIRSLLWGFGLRFRVKASMYGKPDIVFGKRKLAVFIDGCFWHQCPVHFTAPASNKSFWRNKMANNIRRDMKVNEILKEQGWHVLRFWEHDVKKDAQKIAQKVLKKYNKLR
jgi:DNA mismatch endonuclease (patch repair protein)